MPLLPVLHPPGEPDRQGQDGQLVGDEHARGQRQERHQDRPLLRAHLRGGQGDLDDKGPARPVDDAGVGLEELPFVSFGGVLRLVQGRHLGGDALGPEEGSHLVLELEAPPADRLLVRPEDEPLFGPQLHVLDRPMGHRVAQDGVQSGERHGLSGADPLVDQGAGDGARDGGIPQLGVVDRPVLGDPVAHHDRPDGEAEQGHHAQGDEAAQGGAGDRRDRRVVRAQPESRSSPLRFATATASSCEWASSLRIREPV